MLVLLGAFLANVSGRVRAESGAYNAANAVGAAILAWYSVQLSVWVFAILESVWALAAVWRLARWRRTVASGSPRSSAGGGPQASRP